MSQTIIVLKTAAKTAFLATFLLGIYFEIYDPASWLDLLLLLCVAYIITSVLSVIFVVVSIAPILILNDQRNKREQFRCYVPYYTMSFFTGVAVLSIYAEFDENIVVILVIGYLIAAQSWIWLFKDGMK